MESILSSAIRNLGGAKLHDSKTALLHAHTFFIYFNKGIIAMRLHYNKACAISAHMHTLVYKTMGYFSVQYKICTLIVDNKYSNS